MNQIEREMEQLEQDLVDGLISQEEFRKQMRELQREYRDMVEEEAERAADSVRDFYGY